MKLYALCADRARWQARRRRDDPALVGKRETPPRGPGRNFVGAIDNAFLSRRRGQWPSRNFRTFDVHEMSLPSVIRQG